MIEFAYDNAKNASIGYTSLNLNCGYYLYIFFEDDTNSHPKSYLAKKSIKKLRDLMFIY